MRTPTPLAALLLPFVLISCQDSESRVATAARASSTCSPSYPYCFENIDLGAHPECAPTDPDTTAADIPTECFTEWNSPCNACPEHETESIELSDPDDPPTPASIRPALLVTDADEISDATFDDIEDLAADQPYELDYKGDEGPQPGEHVIKFHPQGRVFGCEDLRFRIEPMTIVSGDTLTVRVDGSDELVLTGPHTIGANYDTGWYRGDEYEFVLDVGDKDPGDPLSGQLHISTYQTQPDTGCPEHAVRLSEHTVLVVNHGNDHDEFILDLREYGVVEGNAPLTAFTVADPNVEPSASSGIQVANHDSTPNALTRTVFGLLNNTAGGGHADTTVLIIDGLLDSADETDIRKVDAYYFDDGDGMEIGGSDPSQAPEHPTYGSGQSHGSQVASLIFSKQDGANFSGLAENSRRIHIGTRALQGEIGAVTSIADLFANFSDGLALVIRGLWHARFNEDVDAINMSIGTPYSFALEVALRAHYNNGAFLVASAGNDSQPPSQLPFPANLPFVVAAGSLGSINAQYQIVNLSQRSDYSAYGVDIAAAGTTKVPYYLSNGSTGVATSAGTSFAAPLVAGTYINTLAYHREVNQTAGFTTLTPNAQRDLVWRAMQLSARDLGPEGFDLEVGAGEIQGVDAIDAVDWLLDPAHELRAERMVNAAGTYQDLADVDIEEDGVTEVKVNYGFSWGKCVANLDHLFEPSKFTVQPPKLWMKVTDWQKSDLALQTAPTSLKEAYRYAVWNKVRINVEAHNFLSCYLGFIFSPIKLRFEAEHKGIPTKSSSSTTTFALDHRGWKTASHRSTLPGEYTWEWTQDVNEPWAFLIDLFGINISGESYLGRIKELALEALFPLAEDNVRRMVERKMNLSHAIEPWSEMDYFGRRVNPALRDSPRLRPYDASSVYTQESDPNDETSFYGHKDMSFELPVLTDPALPGRVTDQFPKAPFNPTPTTTGSDVDDYSNQEFLTDWAMNLMDAYGLHDMPKLASTFTTKWNPDVWVELRNIRPAKRARAEVNSAAASGTNYGYLVTEMAADLWVCIPMVAPYWTPFPVQPEPMRVATPDCLQDMQTVVKWVSKYPLSKDNVFRQKDYDPDGPPRFETIWRVDTENIEIEMVQDDACEAGCAPPQVCMNGTCVDPAVSCDATTNCPNSWETCDPAGRCRPNAVLNPCTMGLSDTQMEIFIRGGFVPWELRKVQAIGDTRWQKDFDSGENWKTLEEFYRIDRVRQALDITDFELIGFDGPALVYSHNEQDPMPDRTFFEGPAGTSPSVRMSIDFDDEGAVSLGGVGSRTIAQLYTDIDGMCLGFPGAVRRFGAHTLTNIDRSSSMDGRYMTRYDSGGSRTWYTSDMWIAEDPMIHIRNWAPGDRVLLVPRLDATPAESQTRLCGSPRPGCNVSVMDLQPENLDHTFERVFFSRQKTLIRADACLPTLDLAFNYFRHNPPGNGSDGAPNSWDDVPQHHMKFYYSRDFREQPVRLGAGTRVARDTYGPDPCTEAEESEASYWFGALPGLTAPGGNPPVGPGDQVVCEGPSVCGSSELVCHDGACVEPAP